MKKNTLICLLLLGCLMLCACEKTEAAPTVAVAVPETTVTETPVTETTEPTAAATTVPTTEPPREIGPEWAEGNAARIEHVSVDYSETLPQNIKSSTTYSVCGFKEEFILNESQVYAQIHFTITNKTQGEMKIADIHDDFLVELIYDNRFVYSPDTHSWCFFKAGPQTAVVSDSMSVGSVTLAPLSTMDVIVYMPCAREVFTELDKYLMIVFTSNYSGYENFDFIIR